jgi:hypothetical protein
MGYYSVDVTESLVCDRILKASNNKNPGLGRMVCVPRRGAQSPVAEEGADLVERRACVRQHRRQAMAQVVAPVMYPQIGR